MKEFDFSFIQNNFYKIEKDKLSSDIFDRLSSSKINYEKINNKEEYYKKAYNFLKENSNSLFKFITQEDEASNVILKANTNSSYCSLVTNLIQLGILLLANEKLENQFKVDCINAILLHEMFHKRFTNKSISDLIKVDKKDYYNNKETIEKNFLEVHCKNNLHIFVLNILEDRRIELLGVRDFPGYVFYFEELRKYAFYLHRYITDHQSFNFNEVIKNYLIYKILLPEISDWFLEQIHTKEIKLSKKGLDIIDRLDNYINDNIKEIDYEEFSMILIHQKKILEILPEEMDNLKSETEIFISNDDESGEGIELLEKIINAENEKDQKINKDENFRLSLKSKNDFKFVNLTIKEVEIPKIIDSSIYNEAKRISNLISKNLMLLESKQKKYEEEYELNEGEIDEDELYSIKYNKNVFKNEVEISDYALDICILLDESGSMSTLMNEAQIAVLSLTLALKANKKINLLVFGHTFYYDKGVYIYKYYNNKTGYSNEKRILGSFSKEGNADGYAIEYAGLQLHKFSSNKSKKILIVVSDGQPAATDYGGEEAMAHVKKQVEDLEKLGVETIQICMANIEDSNKMFKHYIPFKSDSSFTNSFVKLINLQLLKIFNKI